MESKKEFAKEFARKINWADIIGNIDNLKVEMIWRLYAQNVFSGMEVSAIQYQETKQAFFCGFAECFRILSDVSERYDENQASDILSRLSKESNTFIESLVDRTLK